jgi:hypothetical protein
MFRRSLFRLCRAAALAALTASLSAGALRGGEPTVAELKARLSSTTIGDRPRLCVQIAEKQLAEADKLYAAAEVEKAQMALTDVVAFSELARDYAIQSHKYEKQTEIAVRTMARKLADIKHVVAHDDQAPIQDAITSLQQIRDDLLAAMFHKGAK